MCVLRGLRPDAVVSAARGFVAHHLGPDFARARPPIDLQVGIERKPIPRAWTQVANGVCCSVVQKVLVHWGKCWVSSPAGVF